MAELAPLEKIKFLNSNESRKKMLLDFLGYFVDEEGYVVNKSDQKIVICEYTKEKVLFKNASILPGSTKIINTSPYTLSSYISDYLAGEKIEHGHNRNH